MITLYFKYGKVSDSVRSEATDFLKSLELRLERAKEKKNTEFLVDVVYASTQKSGASSNR